MHLLKGTCSRCVFGFEKSLRYHMEMQHFKRYPQTRIKIYRLRSIFSIKINDIVKCSGNLTDCSIYVDDFCICNRSKSMGTIERQLQQNLNKIENWATSNGFKFSK